MITPILIVLGVSLGLGLLLFLIFRAVCRRVERNFENPVFPPMCEERPIYLGEWAP